MHPKLEETMARGRAAGVTQRVAQSIGADGRTVRLAPDGQEVASFATCSYLGLDRDPRLARAAIAAIERHGVAFSASRCFVTSPLYREAEELLAQVFGRPVVLAGSTTLAHAAALPILLEDDDVVLFDRQVHHSVQHALTALGPRGPRRELLPHNNLDALDTAVQHALAQGAKRVWYCADGIYSMFGDRLPVEGLRELMERHPALHAYLDDAHGMSWCGSHGAGSLIDAGLPVERTVIATSLSKGFGCAGGLLAVPDVRTKERIENLGPSLMFSIQLPPPMLGAIVASARVHVSDEIDTLQEELDDRMRLAEHLLQSSRTIAPRLAIREDRPTPVKYVILGGADEAITATRLLLSRGYLVNPVAFPAVPLRAGGIRFTLARAHTEHDVRGLVSAIETIILEEKGAARPASRFATSSL